MGLTHAQERIIVAPSRGKTDAAKRYEFRIEKDGQDQEVLLTTGLDVTFLLARGFTENSLLVLYVTGGPVTPQFVVAEFDFDDVHVSHTHDHGGDLPTAFKDFHDRALGVPTATPPTAHPQQQEFDFEGTAAQSPDA